MIIVRISGGMGNQLFQWAYGKSLSLSHNENLYLDISLYVKNKYRAYSLTKFPNFKCDTLNGVPFQTVISDDWNFKNLNIDDKDYYLNGYWQSEKYFLKHRREILNELSPANHMKELLLQKYPLDSNCVSMHIRRTDYVNLQDHHPVQPIEYYEEALSIIGGYDNLLVFSDDIKWCENNLKFNNIIFVKGNSDIEDLWAMSLCKNNIIANSTFSWWGAWMNENNGKRVVAPKMWFGHKLKNLDTSSVIPETWVKI